MRRKKFFVTIILLLLVIFSPKLLNVNGAIEVEGNINVKNAFQIPYTPFETLINLNTKNEERWFKININEVSSIDVDMSSGGAIMFDLYSEEGIKDVNPTYLYRDYVDHNSSYKVNPGTYYIKFWHRDGKEDRDFDVTIKIVEEDVYEPNDTYQQSEIIQLNEYIPIKISAVNDSDWFKVELFQAASINIDIDSRAALLFELYSEEDLKKEKFNYIQQGYVDHNISYRVEAGTYYLKFYHRDGWEDRVFNIKVKIIDDDKFEPNNSYRQAKNIQFNEENPIKLSAINDIDWFKFEVSETSSINIDMNPHGDVGYELYLEEDLIEGNPIYRANVDHNKTYKLEEGTYYLKIWHNSGWEDKIFNFTIKSIEDEYYEPNDMYQQAYSITLNEELPIKLSAINDIDWFKFEVSETSSINIDMNPHGDVGYELYLEEDLIEGNPIYRANVDHNKTYKLEEGTYYLKIWHNSGWEDKLFNLIVKQVVDDQFEYNDTIGTAKELLLNEEQLININAPNDIDWFKFNLEEDQKLRLGATSNFSKTFKYEIYSAENTLEIINIGSLNTRNGNVGVSLKSGDYYLKLYGDSNNYSPEMISFLVAQDDVDLNRITVNSYAPGGNWQDVYQNIEITFSQPLKSVTKDCFDIKWFNDSIDFEVQYIEGDTKVTLIPTEGLNYSSDYTVSVSKELKGQNNNLTMNNDFNWTFRTRDKRPTDSQVGVIGGKVILPKELQDLVIAAKVQLIQNNRVIKTISPKSDGKFTTSDVAIGKYDIRVKLAGFLSDSQTINLSYGDDLYLELNPIVGDLNGDGIIDLYDITTISSQYNQESK